jgi:outer membrane protein TolC
MKLGHLITAAVVALPGLSFAQSEQPLTRAAVRAQLVELQKAGYNPSSDQTQYPKNIQAAQARLDAASPSYGPSTSGASVSGSRSTGSQIVGLNSIYSNP